MRPSLNDLSESFKGHLNQKYSEILDLRTKSAFGHFLHLVTILLALQSHLSTESPFDHLLSKLETILADYLFARLFIDH